jgi:DNA repair photolyase
LAVSAQVFHCVAKFQLYVTCGTHCSFCFWAVQGLFES